MTSDPTVNAPYVSTGHLPPEEHVRLLVEEAYNRIRGKHRRRRFTRVSVACKVLILTNSAFAWRTPEALPPRREMRRSSSRS